MEEGLKEEDREEWRRKIKGTEEKEAGGVRGTTKTAMLEQ